MKYGLVKKWAKIPNYENYLVSSDGEIISSKGLHESRNGRVVIYKDKEIKANKNHKGYLRVWLYKDFKRTQMFVHKAVALAFIDNPHSYNQINHKNGIKDDNTLDNIEWCDSLYNIRHRYEVLKQKIPQKKGKITKSEFEEILINPNKNPNSYFMEKYNLSRGHICSIKKGKYRLEWYNQIKHLL